MKSFSGYVHLPPHSLNEKHENQTYPINTFFWFFEARKDPHNAPLAIWLNGGPGGSSMMGALSENGPCFVNADSNSTYLNPWSWNNEVNMLYIDQPVQVGFSYDILTNITKNLAAGYGDEIEILEEGAKIPKQNNTFFVGTSGSQNIQSTANSTRHAAKAMWHFAQTWFEEFPEYKPNDDRISIYGESYGGRYVPQIVDFFLGQNEKIKNGEIKTPGAKYIHLDTMGIINGCIDPLHQTRAYIDFSRKNTYGLQVTTEAQYHEAEFHYYREDGMRDRINKCRKMEAERDPHNHGDIEEINNYCRETWEYVATYTEEFYTSSGKFARFDVTHEMLDPFPPGYLSGFLDQHWVQAALGVPVNFSSSAAAVWKAFQASGDEIKGDQLDVIAYALDHGIKTHFIYGDRDFACNWINGESTSLDIPWHGQEEFAKAGYASLVATGEPYVESHGLTRQYGNFSFTRVFQSGHLVPSYQPEASYRIFMRSLLNKDIATGLVDTAANPEYSTKGPSDTWWMLSEVLPSPPRFCYTLDQAACTEEEKEWLRNGEAIVKDWIVVGHEKAGKKVEEEKMVPGSRDQEPLVADY